MRVFRIEHRLHLWGAFQGSRDAGISGGTRARLAREAHELHRGHASNPWDMPSPSWDKRHRHSTVPGSCGFAGLVFGYPDIVELDYWWAPNWRAEWHNHGFVVNVYAVAEFIRYATQVAFARSTAELTETLNLHTLRSYSHAQALAA